MYLSILQSYTCTSRDQWISSADSSRSLRTGKRHQRGQRQNTGGVISCSAVLSSSLIVWSWWVGSDLGAGILGSWGVKLQKCDVYSYTPALTCKAR